MTESHGHVYVFGRLGVMLCAAGALTVAVTARTLAGTTPSKTRPSTALKPSASRTVKLPTRASAAQGV